MKNPLTFVQIFFATILGIFFTDLVKIYSNQCVSKDYSGCVETRYKCILNSKISPPIIISCLSERSL